jgi:hypothetical protein
MITTAKRLTLALLICLSSGAALTGAIGVVAFAILLLLHADGANVSAFGWAVILLGAGLGGLWLSDYLEANL